MGILLAGMILVSVLIQGGFYPTIFLGASCILAGTALFAKTRKLDYCDWFIWGLAGLYLIASLVNGYASESLGQACLPGACALFLLLYRNLSAAKKAGLQKTVLLGGGLFAGIALLAFCDIVPLSGAVISHRLQFTFQYANAAGSWFAALALLAQENKDSRIRRLFLPLVATLLLTRSVGALGLYFLLQLIRLWQRRKEKLWQEAVLTHVISTGFAVALYFVNGWMAVAVLILLFVAGWYWEVLLGIGRKFHLEWVSLLAGGLGVMSALLSQRFSSGLRTFAERLVQIWDGLHIIAAHPLWGIGAGNWEEVYPCYQSAQYASTVVHSSMIQIGVDAGIFAIILATVFLAFAWRQTGRNSSESLAAGLLVAHGLLDFTMQFFPIDAILLMLLFAGEEPAPAEQKRSFLYHSNAFVLGVLCVILLYGQTQYKQIAYQAQAEEWEAVCENYERQQPLFGQSPTVRNLYVRALYNSGDLRGVIEATEGIPNVRTEEFLFRAQALRQLGRQDDACRLLLEQLKRRLYQVRLFERTAQLLQEWDADTAWLDAYNQIVDQANGSQTILGALKGDQVHIDSI